jgi:hypothetical protein
MISIDLNRLYFRSEYKVAQDLFSENINETVDQHLSENFRKETIYSA